MTATPARSLVGGVRSVAGLAGRFAPRVWRVLLAAWTLRALITIVELLLVRSVGRGLLQGDGVRDLLPTLVGLSLTLLVTGLIDVAVGEAEVVLLDRINDGLELELADASVRAPASSLQDPTFHDDLSRAQQAAREHTWQLINAATGIGLGALTMLALLVVLVFSAPLLLPVALIGGIPLWLVTRRNSEDRWTFEYAQSPNDRERRALAPLLTGGAAAMEIKALGAGARLRRRLSDLWALRHRARRDAIRRRLPRSLLATTLSSVAVAGGAGVIASLAATDRVRLADAAVGVMVLRQIASQLRSFTTAIGNLQEGMLFVHDLERLVSSTSVSERTLPPAGPLEELQLDGVRFRYPSAVDWALDGVDLSLRRNEVLALVGPNGSGKSTLVKLLTFLFRPTAGRVLWNGVDATELDEASLRASVATVFQDTVRYPLTAEESIALGRAESPTLAVGRAPEEPVDAGIVDAARRAGIDDVLGALNAGYRTRLSKEFTDGVELSGGQAQRVALARAFFRDAPLLVLDEPTSALDARAEADFFDRLRDLAAGKTVILISHRFSTVRRADRIVVLDGGRVAQVGTHDELMARGGYYAEAFAMQAAAYLDEV